MTDFQSANQVAMNGYFVVAGVIILVGLLGVISMVPALFGLGIFIAGLAGILRAWLGRLRAV